VSSFVVILDLRTTKYRTLRENLDYISSLSLVLWIGFVLNKYRTLRRI
jgi:hypothetical protein